MTPGLDRVAAIGAKKIFFYFSRRGHSRAARRERKPLGRASPDQPDPAPGRRRICGICDIEGQRFS